MNLNIIEDYKLLKGGLDIKILEKLIYRLVNLFYIYNISWLEGIKSLNDLIYLKKHDSSKLSSEIGKLILSWIEAKYDEELLSNFTGSSFPVKKELKDTAKLINLTLDTIRNISENTDVLPFLNLKLEESSNEHIKHKLSILIERIENFKVLEQNISDKILDKILLKSDEYFEEEYNEKRLNFLFCGLRETIQEHTLCYTIGWCKKSDKYAYKSGWVGAGPLMISKTFDKFEIMGSSPMVDWLYLFELDVQNLEEYFYMEIPFEKRNLLKLKSVIKCSTEELLGKVNEKGKIIYTQSKKWCDHYPDFQYMADELIEKGINCIIEIRIREK
ncbi:hypothetical protein H3Z83_11010 [Tenacibaculum sp. S7007]|uniref:Uncharacterized protein n=1 Tax=Tenacibaculum pelagium TaxID=2759527 RepID=A0A839AR00_9FLAO|nr:hypothetical protein [Tenacibaculum pelagium]MBA6157047.1 hypothetical protein [Tenacibaculum pelagium]